MLPYMWAAQDKCIETPAAAMVNGNTIFTITGGPIIILDLFSECVTANGATASTLQWQSNPTLGSAKAISGASASLANATAGTTLRLNPATLSTTLDTATAANGGVILASAQTNTSRIIVKAGTITMVIGVGSTTGTWRHYLRYTPLSPNALVN